MKTNKLFWSDPANAPRRQYKWTLDIISYETGNAVSDWYSFSSFKKNNDDIEIVYTPAENDRDFEELLSSINDEFIIKIKFLTSEIFKKEDLATIKSFDYLCKLIDYDFTLNYSSDKPLKINLKFKRL